MQEALAFKRAMEKFAEFVIKKEMMLDTDHKPIVLLFGKKSLEFLPPVVMRFRLHLARFQYIIHQSVERHYTLQTCYHGPLLKNQTVRLTVFLQKLSSLLELRIIAALPASPA